MLSILTIIVIVVVSLIYLNYSNIIAIFNGTDNKNEHLDDYEETHSAEALVLSCIDYRFVDSLVTFLQSGPLANSHDISSLAGSSLGYLQNEFPHWSKTFIDIVNLAIELHHIKRIVVFDHMDCGAYVKFYPHINPNSPEERELHIKNIHKFVRELGRKYPQLSFDGYLIDIDGNPEKIV